MLKYTSQSLRHTQYALYLQFIVYCMYIDENTYTQYV